MNESNTSASIAFSYRGAALPKVILQKKKKALTFVPHITKERCIVKRKPFWCEIPEKRQKTALVQAPSCWAGNNPAQGQALAACLHGELDIES